MRDVTIALDDPFAPDVLELLERHLALMYAATPICEVYALDAHALARPEIAFFSARRRGDVVAVGALKEIDAEHGELKSMHTVEAARGQGLGRAMLDHLLTVGRSRGYARISLETGATDVFTPARSLYTSVGFMTCPPFGEYAASPNSVCMTLPL